MRKLKYILTCLFAVGLIAGSAMAQNAKVCYVIPDKDQDQKITVTEAISWAENVPVVVNCDDKQMYTIYSFDISIFQRKPLMTRGFGTGIEGVPLMALNAIKEAKAGDTIVLRNIICKGDDGNDIEIPMVSIELTAGNTDGRELMKDSMEDQKKEE